ncbi:MAG: 3-hydroxy-3-methylglutaryl-CoA reductase, partial [Chloroflexi bacterium]|nr:3-hydroxy-3-methylglutaryl-CoA reductase [Chloroflexota bacterium]
MTQSSRLTGFYNRPLEERIEQVAQRAELTEDETATLRGAMGLSLARADQMI